MVNRGNIFTKVKASMNKTKVKEELLIERMIDGRPSDTTTFSRARQLAILGVVGYDISKK